MLHEKCLSKMTPAILYCSSQPGLLEEPDKAVYLYLNIQMDGKGTGSLLATLQAN